MKALGRGRELTLRSDFGTPGKALVCILQETEWTPRPVWSEEKFPSPPPLGIESGPFSRRVRNLGSANELERVRENFNLTKTYQE